MRGVLVVVVVVMVLVVGACDRGPPTTPSDADCAAAASAIVKAGRGESSENAVVQLRCVEDRWSLAAVRCLRLAPDATAMTECRRQHLTVIQDEKLGEITASAREAMAMMSRFRDDMCACRDAECAKAVSDRMTKWAQEQAGRTREPVKMSEQDQKRATEIGTSMGECMQRAMGMGAQSD